MSPLLPWFHLVCSVEAASQRTNGEQGRDGDGQRARQWSAGEQQVLKPSRLLDHIHVCVCSQCVFRTCTGPWLVVCGRRLTSVPCGQAFPHIPRTGHAKLQATRHARPFTLPHCTNSHFFTVHFLQKCFQVLRPESGLRLLWFVPFTPRTSQRASLCKEAHGALDHAAGSKPCPTPWARGPVS